MNHLSCESLKIHQLDVIVDLVQFSAPVLNPRYIGTVPMYRGGAQC